MYKNANYLEGLLFISDLFETVGSITESLLMTGHFEKSALEGGWFIWNSMTDDI